MVWRRVKQEQEQAAPPDPSHSWRAQRWKSDQLLPTKVLSPCQALCLLPHMSSVRGYNLKSITWLQDSKEVSHWAMHFKIPCRHYLVQLVCKTHRGPLPSFSYNLSLLRSTAIKQQYELWGLSDGKLGWKGPCRCFYNPYLKCAKTLAPTRLVWDSYKPSHSWGDF